MVKNSEPDLQTVSTTDERKSPLIVSHSGGGSGISILFTEENEGNEVALRIAAGRLSAIRAHQCNLWLKLRSLIKVRMCRRYSARLLDSNVEFVSTESQFGNEITSELRQFCPPAKAILAVEL